MDTSHRRGADQDDRMINLRRMKCSQKLKIPAKSTKSNVVSGKICIFTREPEEEVRLTAGQTYSIRPGRPHLVTNAGDASAVFLVLQGMGEYDFVPLR